MRKTPAFLAILGLSAAALVGCSTTAADSCARVTDTDPAVTDLVNVDGEFGAAPDVEVFTPFHVDELAWSDLSTGEGEPITTPAQMVVLDMVVVNGATGETVVSTSYDESLASVFSMDRWIQTLPGLEDALQCAQEGERIVVALPAASINPQAATQIGLEADDSAVAVVDVRKVYLPKADGADQFTDSNGLPSVVRAPDGRPGVVIPDSPAPTELSVQTLKRGNGPVVTGDQPVRVHYTGLVWDTREVFQTTWDTEPASLTLDAVVPGFAAALEGQTVGSQVLVVIPPDQGYGDTAQGPIPAGSTLVFVIDILGLDPLPAS